MLVCIEKVYLSFTLREHVAYCPMHLSKLDNHFPKTLVKTVTICNNTTRNLRISQNNPEKERVSNP